MVKWKEALEKVANLAGFPFPSASFRDESECIEKIVQEVLSKLPNRTMPACCELSGWIGVSWRRIVQEVSSKLSNRTMLACCELSGWIGVSRRIIVFFFLDKDAF